jgi:hypothetical protein
VKTSTFLSAISDEPECFDAAAMDRFVADHAADTSLLLDLFHLTESGEAGVQIATTGLLKRYLDHRVPLSDALVVRLLDLLPSVEHWEAILHLLQMLSRLSIPHSHADALCGWLRQLTRHSNTFVRAWAYSGLHRVAELHADYRADISPLLEVAAQEESASVRARLRQLPPLDNVPSSNPR